MGKSKDPIRLRKRQLRNGNTSLYLDIYIDGKRSYEFLNLYLVPEKGRADKDKNKETLRLAEAIRATRIVDLQNGRFGFEGEFKQDTNFLEYFRALCEKRRQNARSLGSWGIWNSTLNYLERYCQPNMTFRDLTPKFVQGFKEFLDKSARVTDLRRNDLPAEDMERERVCLTLEEVRAMAAAECKYPILRRAFLFSCLTGLRKSDIEKMKWSEVRQQGEFTRIVFKQKKTGGQEYIDINPQAVAFMGERRNPEDHVFANFSYSSFYLYELKRWALAAGITKDITFHSGRHTFAVMMLDLGADIYTVQKLLGHKEIHTTQIYAKVMDKKKQEAAMLIPPILPIENKE